MAQQTTKEYEVQKILDRKKIGKTILYLVHWKGSSNQDATWQPIYHLSRCERAIRQYQSKKNGKQHKNVKMNHFANKVFGKGKQSNKIETSTLLKRNQSNEDFQGKKSLQLHSRSRQGKRKAKLTVTIGKKKSCSRQTKLKSQNEIIQISQNANFTSISNFTQKLSDNKPKKIVYTLDFAKTNKSKSVKNKQEQVNAEQKNIKIISSLSHQKIINSESSNVRNQKPQQIKIWGQKKSQTKPSQLISKLKETKYNSEQQIILSQIAKVNKEQDINILSAKNTLEPYIDLLKRKKQPQFRVDYAQQIQKAMIQLSLRRDQDINAYIDKYFIKYPNNKSVDIPLRHQQNKIISLHGKKQNIHLIDQYYPD